MQPALPVPCSRSDSRAHDELAVRWPLQPPRLPNAGRAKLLFCSGTGCAEMFSEHFFFREKKIRVFQIRRAHCSHGVDWENEDKALAGVMSIGYVGGPPTSPGGNNSRTAYTSTASCFGGWFPETSELP